MDLHSTFLLSVILTLLILKTSQENVPQFFPHHQHHHYHVNNYILTKTWNGVENLPDGEEIYVSFWIEKQCDENSFLRIVTNAPFYNDPPIPTNSTLSPLWGLWEYEVVELYFYGRDENYMEIQLGPGGHYLILKLHGYRNITETHLPLEEDNFQVEFMTTPENQNLTRWIGNVAIPGEYIPCDVYRHNAFAIHKSGSERRYVALYPVKEGEIEEPDFHYLRPFKGFRFDEEINTRCKSGRKVRSGSGVNKANCMVLLFMFFVLI
ncbi:hypothetical protein Fcan01_10867 [Folsomia candida]|uniref:Uncharacterized protein n=1 Tax=Folsomia candida TaxID=158441 RepID=A0A226E9M6_FOLCA|nr:hypothetical protein Fcan01_10867 [Folsomia candida]